MNNPNEIPSLYQLTLTKIALNIWNLPVVVSLIHERGSRDFGFSYIQREVTEKATLLPIYATIVKNDIITRARFVGVQVSEWIRTVANIRLRGNLEEESIFFYFDRYPAHLHIHLLSWTNMGTVDHLKTAQALINASAVNQLGIAQSFHLACFYCMDNVIQSLWYRMNTRTRLFKAELVNERLESFWIGVLLGRTTFDPLRGFKVPCYYFENGIARGYFWEKLSDSHKKTLLQLAFPLEKEFNEIDIFLFTKLDEEKQSLILEKYPYLVMNSSLWNAKYELFVAVANSNRVKMLKEEQFLRLCIKLKERNFIFHEFWSMGSAAQRNYVIAQFLQDPPPWTKEHSEGNEIGRITKENNLFLDYWHFFLHGLFESGDVLGLESILKSLDTNQSSKMMEIYGRGRQICKQLIVDQKWELLRFFRREFVTSKEALRKLGRDLDEHFNQRPNQLDRASKWPTVKVEVFADVEMELEERMDCSVG